MGKVLIGVPPNALRQIFGQSVIEAHLAVRREAEPQAGDIAELPDVQAIDVCRRKVPPVNTWAGWN